MRILTILGSPRKHGNTDAVLRRFENQAGDAGHVVTRVNVVDHEVGGCLGCDNCQAILEDFGCAQNDEAEELLGQIAAADLTLFAAPVYCWSLPAQLKALFDRHYCTVKYEDGEVVVQLLKGKPTALLLTCGGGADDNADLTLPMFKRLMDYSGGIIAGTYVLDNCTNPPEDAPRAEVLARRMAIELLSWPPTAATTTCVAARQN
jgi:multimeric flavodoxin WrbA